MVRISVFLLLFTAGYQPAAGLTVSNLPAAGHLWAGGVDGGILPGDADGDLDVDLKDYQLFAAAFGARSLQRAYSRQTDWDGSGQIGLTDFFLLADHFGRRYRAERTALSGGEDGGPGWARRDVNGDGKIDLADFFLFADDYGQDPTPGVGRPKRTARPQSTTAENTAAVFSTATTRRAGQRSGRVGPPASFDTFVFARPTAWLPLQTPTVGAAVDRSATLVPRPGVPIEQLAVSGVLPVPEGTSLSLFSCGLLLLAGWVRWSRSL